MAGIVMCGAPNSALRRSQDSDECMIPDAALGTVTHCVGFRLCFKLCLADSKQHSILVPLSAADESTTQGHG
jgi:hypothetical protein